MPEIAVPRRLRLGMVGGGSGAFIGAVHRIAARVDDRYELVAAALSADPERSRSSAASLHIPQDRAYSNFEEMARGETARQDRIDAVSVVTPNHFHFPVAKVFLDAGFHVICDKPLTTTLGDAEELVGIVHRTDLLFALTHNYTGYPMVRQAREMVAAGELGKLRIIQVEYPQDWLTMPLEQTGQKQAAWRTDPSRSGPAGSLGDIGTHAYNLARFVTQAECEEVCADLQRFVPGRRLDDNVEVLLRFAGGVRGMLWASQVAAGNENNLKLRAYGEKGGLEWEQEDANTLRFLPYGKPLQIIRRGGPSSMPVAAYASRVPSGHPEGYLEAFAQLYTDFAEQIHAKLEKREPDPRSLLVPTVEDGWDGVRFIDAVLASSANNSAWTRLKSSLS